MDTGYISDRVGGRFPELPPEIREKLSGPGGITLSEFSDPAGAVRKVRVNEQTGRRPYGMRV